MQLEMSQQEPFCFVHPVFFYLMNVLVETSHSLNLQILLFYLLFVLNHLLTKENRRWAIMIKQSVSIARQSCHWGRCQDSAYSLCPLYIVSEEAKA